MNVDRIVGDFLTIDKDQLVSWALKLMKKKDFTCLFVVDDNKKLAGIVTLKDIADRLGTTRTERLPAERLHLSSVMTINVISVNSETDVVEAAQIMLDNNISNLPVLAKNSGEIIGLLTKFDFVGLCQKIDDIPIEQIMSKNPFSVSPTERIVHARQIMLEKKISSLPVLDDGNLIGLISLDLIAHFLADFRAATPKKHQEERIRHLPVENAMHVDPVNMGPDSSVGEVAKLMLNESVKSVPIVDEIYNLIGIVTLTDFTRLVANRFKINQ